ADIPALVDEAIRLALEPPTGPTFVDFPLDHVFMEASPLGSPSAVRRSPAEHVPDVGHVAELLRDAERPVVMAGTGLYWARGEDALLRLVDELSIPVFLNGLARGCVPAGHASFFSRARSAGLKGADVALVIGVPMDFRLGFGESFGEDTRLVAIGSVEPERPHPRPVAGELYGRVPAVLDALRE